nr:M15 family metallopeptidase [Pseudalkalibacillus caeni]
MPQEEEQHQKDAKMPDKLHPVVEKKKNKLIRRAEDKGINVVITEGFRSVEKQNELYQQGRSDESNIVTNAKGGESYHNYGLAIDFALKRKDDVITWDLEYDGNNNGKSDWLEIVKIAKSLGFQWGGDWQHFKDYPHLQMDFGLTIRELQNGRWPPKEDA